MSAPLSKTGERLLAHAERVIEDGLSTFMKVGKALTEIRDGRLYRAEYDTFEAYCEGRWQFTARRARQMMDAAEMGTMVPVSNERQARALAPLADDPEAARAAWDEANEDGKPTAAKLAQAVQRRTTTTETTETTFDPETGEIIQTSGEEGGEDGEGYGGTAAPTSPTSSPVLPAIDPTLGYRARATAERSKVSGGLLTLDPERIIATTDHPEEWASFARGVRSWLDALDSELVGPKLRAVK